MKSSENGKGKSCGKRVLIIEDDEDIGKILKKRFKDTGFEVETADTGYSVLSKLKSMKAPHVVILDLVLPERSGVELLVSIKGKWPFVKVFIFTAHEQYKKKAHLFREYIAGFFLKTEMAEMIATIKESEKIK